MSSFELLDICSTNRSCRCIEALPFSYYFMCLFFEMLLVNKCHNLSGGKSLPITLNIFPMPKIWNYFFEIIGLSGICENITDVFHEMK